MKEIVLGSTNEGKIADFLASGFFEGVRVYSLKDFDNVPDVEESGSTLRENALLKARAIFEATHLPTLADDSGFFVHALGGFPGVHSARVAGPEKDFARVKRGMWQKLMTQSDKTAHFSTAVAFIGADQEHVVEATTYGLFVDEGESTKEDPRGYRDVFRPEGASGTVAELTPAQKERFLPRLKALTVISRVWLLQKEGDSLT